MKKQIIAAALLLILSACPALAQNSGGAAPINYTITMLKSSISKGEDRLIGECTSVFLSRELLLIPAKCIPERYLQKPCDGFNVSAAKCTPKDDRGDMYLYVTDNWIKRKESAARVMVKDINEDYSLIYLPSMSYYDIEIPLPLLRVSSLQTPLRNEDSFNISPRPFVPGTAAASSSGERSINKIEAVYGKNLSTGEDVIESLKITRPKTSAPVTLNITKKEAYIIAYVAKSVRKEVKFVDDNLTPLNLDEEIKVILSEKTDSKNIYKQALLNTAKEIETHEANIVIYDKK